MDNIEPRKERADLTEKECIDHSSIKPWVNLSSELHGWSHINQMMYWCKCCPGARELLEKQMSSHPFLTAEESRFIDHSQMAWTIVFLLYGSCSECNLQGRRSLMAPHQIHACIYLLALVVNYRENGLSLCIINQVVEPWCTSQPESNMVG